MSKRNIIIFTMISFIFSIFFIISDNYNQFMFLCRKDFSFSLSIYLLFIISMFHVNEMKENKILWFLFSIFMTYLFGYFAIDFLPDSWLWFQQELSRKYPIIEFSWTFIIFFIFIYIIYKKEIKNLLTLFLIMVALTTSASSIRVIEHEKIYDIENLKEKMDKELKVDFISKNFKNIENNKSELVNIQKQGIYFYLGNILIFISCFTSILALLRMTFGKYNE